MPRYVNVLAFITIFEMMISVGLRVTLAGVTAVTCNYWLVVRALIANYIFVPAVTVLLLLLFHTNPMISAGFAIIAVCPGAPFAPPFTALAKGHVVTAVGLMFVLAASSAILAPVLLRFLLPLLASGQAVKVSFLSLIGTLILGQLLPLAIGLTINRRWPAIARRLESPASRISTILNLSLVVILLNLQFQTLSHIHLRGYIGMAALLISSLFIGWFFGGRDPQHRRALAITTGVRNVGVGLLIVINLLPATPAVTAATAYALLQTIAAALIAIAWGRFSAIPAEPA